MSLKPNYNNNKKYHELYHEQQELMFESLRNQNKGFFVSFWKADYYNDENEIDEKFQHSEDENDYDYIVEQVKTIDEIDWNVDDPEFLKSYYSESDSDSDEANDWMFP